MKNDMKKRILSAQLALILLLMLWCGTYFETKTDGTVRSISK